MSYALHRTYERASTDPVGDFLRDAPTLLDLEDIVEAFAAAIAAYDGTGHLCCAIDEDGTLLPLFGDTPSLAGVAAGNPVETVHVETGEGEPLAILIAAMAPASRQDLSMLRMLSTLYATHATSLFEADDETPNEGQITPMEQQCYSLTLAGWSHLDIGERLDRSASAVGVHMRRAATRLGAATIAEAAALIASRGMISQQLPVGTRL